MEQCLNGDAYSAKIPTQCKAARSPGKNNILTSLKQQQLMSGLKPYVVVIDPTSDGSYPKDLTADECPTITTPPLVPATPPCPASATPPGDALVLPIVREIQALPQLPCLSVATHYSPEVANTYKSAATKIKTEDSATGCRGIFNKARASSSEVEWTSDESDHIAPAESSQGLPQPLHSIKCGAYVTASPKRSPVKAYRKKWSEEEHACLVEGVRILGEGRWKEIKNKYREVLKDRDVVHLKDRYRNTEGTRGKRRLQEMVKKERQGTVAQ